MERLAHYTILEKIGEGGMGQVYRARDDRLKREVAIKVLPEAFVRDPERLARFEREAQVLASLQHPNVAAIFGLEEDAGQRFLALEFVPGEDLSHVLGRGPVPVEEAVQIALQIATAVEAAHEVGIVHRDLKPSNVMLTPDHEVKVLDFGLAKAVEGDLSDSSLDLSRSPTLTGLMTDASVILGTAAYMAPEQARGKRVDKRADIWAFGVILFEMLTGSRLFEGETVSDTLASVLKTDPDFDTLPADTPHHVRALLHRCLARDPRLRLRDMGEARIVLSRGEDIGLPAREGEASGVRLPLVAGIAVASLVVGAALGFLLKPVPDSAETASPRMIRVHSGPGEGGTGYDPTLSPDGTRLAFLRDGSIWVRELDGLEPRHLDRTQGVQDIFWSPDGDRIGYLTSSQVMTVDPVTGVPVVVAATGAVISDGSGAGGVWSAEQGILFARGMDHVFRVSDRGGEPSIHVSPDTSREGDLHEPGLLPDGGLLLVPHASGDDGLSVLEVWYGEERVEVARTPGSRVYRPVWSSTGHILYERQEGNPGIWAVPWDLAGRRPRGEPFLVAAQGTYPSVADDGTLAFLRGSVSRRQQIVETDREGTILRRIGEPRRYDFAFALSPDDSRLAVIHEDGSDTEIWIQDLIRGTESRLTFHPMRKGWPVWSRDGRSVLYSIGVTTAERMAVIQEADGRSEFDTLGTRSVGGDISPDGQTMLLSRSVEATSSWDIYIAPAAPGAESRPLVVEEDWQYAPVISPDGNYFAYVSRETGVPQVFLKRFPDGTGKWQVSIDGGGWPKWNAAGDRLVYSQEDRLMEVDIDTSDPPVLGRPRLLFERPPMGYRIRFGFQPDFDMSGDGERFYFMMGAEFDGIETTMVLYQDWERAFADD